MYLEGSLILNFLNIFLFLDLKTKFVLSLSLSIFLLNNFIFFRIKYISKKKSAMGTIAYLSLHSLFLMTLIFQIFFIPLFCASN